MFRRLLSIAGVLGLLGVLLPSTPVSADDDASAVAEVAGTLAFPVPEEPCTVVNGHKPSPPDDDTSKPGNGEDGLIIEFGGLVITGVFSDADGSNVYAGQITANDVIEACSHSILGLDPPLHQVPPSVGDIRDPAGSPDFSGPFTAGKCLDGDLGDLAPFSANPPDPRYGPQGQVGDFVTPANVAFVKFDISWVTRTNALDCGKPTDDASSVKATVNEVDCVGVLEATPPVPDGPAGQVAGEIECANANPSNFGDKK